MRDRNVFARKNANELKGSALAGSVPRSSRPNRAGDWVLVLS